MRLYRDAVGGARPLGAAVNNQVSLNLLCMAGDERGAAERDARDAVLWYARRGLELIQEVARGAAQNEQSYHYLHRAARIDPAEITASYFEYMKAADLVAVGTPEEIIRVAARYHEIGADQILLMVQYGGVAHERVMKTIEILGASVLPELQSWPTPGAITTVA